MGLGFQEKALVMQVYKKSLGVTQTSTQSQGHTENIPFSSKVPAPHILATEPTQGLEKFPPGLAPPQTEQQGLVDSSLS